MSGESTFSWVPVAAVFVPPRNLSPGGAAAFRKDQIGSHRPFFSALLPPAKLRHVPVPEACRARRVALRLRRLRSRAVAAGFAFTFIGPPTSARGDRCKASRWPPISLDRSAPEPDGYCRIWCISMSNARIRNGRELHVGRQQEPGIGGSEGARARAVSKSIAGIPTCCLLRFRREHNTLSRR